MPIKRAAACAPAAPARGRGCYAPLRAVVAAAVCLPRRAACRLTPGAPVRALRPYGGAPHTTPKPSASGISTRGARGRATSAAPDSVDDRIGAHGRRPSTRPRASACCRSCCRSSPVRLIRPPSKTEVAEYKRETGRKGARILPFLESSSKTASSLRENAVSARRQAASRNNEGL